MSVGTVRVAAVQAAPAFLDREATIAKAVALVEEAAAAGARLVAFPETWVPGYPAWIFSAAGWDDPAAKRAFGRLVRNAVEVPSEATDAICRAARAAGAFVVLGMTERDADSSGGTLYNSLLYVSDRGEILGVHRKLMPTHAERIVWGQGDGSTLHVFDTAVGRVGGLACWEHWMPLARYAMHAKGEQIHVAAWPEVGDPELHRFATRHYAFEGRCYALCVIGATLTKEHVPPDFELPEALGAADDFAASAGGEIAGTTVFAPDGTVVASAPAGVETIVYADLDLDRIAEEQQALDVAGHYNRPDVFELRVDERPRRPVHWLRDQAAPAAEEGA
jgi:predicted amidohydrolase